MDVIDMGDPRLVAQVLDGLRGLNSTIVKMYAMPNGVQQMIDSVIGATGGRPGSIRVLRIWGHGWEKGGTTQFVAASAEGDDHMSSFSPENVKTLGCGLDRFASYFAPNARVELRACKVAQGTGKAMMLNLAKRWNVRVQGSLDPEFTLMWLSRIWEATPTGSWRSVIGTQITEER